jgi:hypothetical protein
VLWYQPLAEMQAFSERTGGGLGGLCGFGTPSPYEQARQQFDLLKARLGDGWAGSGSSSSVSAARTSSKKHFVTPCIRWATAWSEMICFQPLRRGSGKRTLTSRSRCSSASNEMSHRQVGGAHLAVPLCTPRRSCHGQPD